MLRQTRSRGNDVLTVYNVFGPVEFPFCGSFPSLYNLTPGVGSYSFKRFVPFVT